MRGPENVRSQWDRAAQVEGQKKRNINLQHVVVIVIPKKQQKHIPEIREPCQEINKKQRTFVGMYLLRV